MAAPFFSYLNYKNSDYGQNNGYIENIQVTSDTGNLLSISWVGPDGYTSGPSSVPLPDLINLEPGTYIGTVVDTVTNETGTIEIEIKPLPQVVLNAVFDSACIGTVNCDCVLDVLDFTHNSDTFKYDLYKNGVLVDTYYGTTGDEAFQFTGLCDGEYFLLATETDQIVYTYDNTYACAQGNVVITPAEVFGWHRFAVYAPHIINNIPTDIDTETGIPSGAPGTFFDPASPSNRGTVSSPSIEGTNPIPAPSLPQAFDWVYNTTLEKYHVYVNNLWVTFNPTKDQSGLLPIAYGDPTAFSSYTTSTQWSLIPLGALQYSVDPVDNKVKLATDFLTGADLDMVSCNLNSNQFNGFYSECTYKDYIHEVTLGSTAGFGGGLIDNDDIGIVLAAYKDVDGKYGPKDFTHTLVLRFNNEAIPTAGIYYNIGNSAFAFTDGAGAYDNFIAQTQDTPFLGTGSGNGNPYIQKGYVRLRIEKTGSNIKIYTSKSMGLPLGDAYNTHERVVKTVGDVNEVNILLFDIDLTDKNTWVGPSGSAPAYATEADLEKFLNPIRIGYLTASQEQTQFFHINIEAEQSNTSSEFADELAATDSFLASIPCGCPEGFVYNVDTAECDIEIEESIICNPLTYTIEKTPEKIEYNAQGAYFYEDASTRPLPLTRSQTISGGTTLGTRIVKDGVGNVLTVKRIVQNLVWGRTFNYDPTIVTFSPSPVDTGLSVTNLAQIAANGLNSDGGWITPTDLGINGYGGRLNAAGIWTNATSGEDQLPLNEWIGFTTCVVVPITKKYCVGISGENRFRFKVDGELYFDFSLASADAYQRWHIVELELSAGNHIFEFEGLNTGGSAAIAAEIYNTSSATLQTITTIQELEAVLEWSTISLVGEQFDSGEESGCHCPTGYSLSSCDGELKCVRYESVPYVKCNCYKAINCEDTEDFFYFTIDSALPPLDLNLIYTFNDPAGRSKSNEFNTKACYRIEDSTNCDVLNANLAVADTFEDCDTCSGTCFKLTDCTNPETVLYIDRTTELELTQYIGKVIGVYFEDLETSYCATVETVPCNQAVNPVIELPYGGIITGDFCDCEECLPKPIQIPEIEINNRTVKPGYNTPGCSTEYVEKISCDYSEALYQEVISKRYGLAFCCAKDLNKLDIKKQLMDFKMITDPDACKAITSDCCPPCNLEVELNVIQTQECLSPASIQPYLLIPAVIPTGPDCRYVQFTFEENPGLGIFASKVRYFDCDTETQIPIEVEYQLYQKEYTIQKCIDVNQGWWIEHPDQVTVTFLGTCP